MAATYFPLWLEKIGFGGISVFVNQEDSRGVLSMSQLGMPAGTDPSFVRRDIGIDLLRAYSILIVMATHFHGSAIGSLSGGMFDAIWLRFTQHGYYGVTLFFVISGFLITRMTLQREADVFRMSFRAFYVRRAARIIPLLVLTVLIGFAFLHLGEPASEIFQLCFRDPNAVFDSSFWTSIVTFTFNWTRILHRGEALGWGLHWDVLWSLAVEEQFYLLFPLTMMLAASRRRLYWMLGGVIGLGLLTRMATDALRAGWLVHFTNSFACFDGLAFGVLTAFLAQQVPATRPAGWLCCAIGAGLVLASFLYVDALGRVWTPVAIALGASLFMYGTQAAPMVHPVWRLPAQFGRLSYGLYLLHSVSLYLLAPFLAGIEMITGFAAYAVVTLLLALVVYEGFESPMNAWIRSALLGRLRVAG